MSWYRARLRFAVLWTVLFVCFSVGFFVGVELSGRAYLLAVYGWTDVHRHGLHIVYHRPTLRVSNGDRASELATFAYELLGMVLDVAFGCFSLVLVSGLTWLLGRRVHVLSALAAGQSHQNDPCGASRQRADVLVFSTMMALIIALSFLILADSLPHTLRNHLIFLAAAAVAIRVAWGGVPDAPELSAPPAGQVDRNARP